MRTPAWEDGDLIYRPSVFELDGTRRVFANGDQTLWSQIRPAPWFSAGEPSSVDQLRRQARAAVLAPRALGQEYSDVQVVGFLRWGGKEWVTPFPSIERARAYFDQAIEIGIDYDYAAFFDVSDPQRPILVWEKLGSPSAISGSGRAIDHARHDLRYDAASGGYMSYPLIGHGGHGGHGGGHGGGGRGRRFFGGGGGGWDYGYPYPAYPPVYPVYADGPDDSGGPDDGVAASGSYLMNPGRTLVSPARDDLRGAADVLGTGGSGLTCQMNLGRDLILRASICVDGVCHEGAADLSQLISDIHAQMHGLDVTEDVVGAWPRQARQARQARQRHHRHRHRHRHRQQDQDQDQDRDQDQDQDRDRDRGYEEQWRPRPDYPPQPAYPQYPYPYPYPPIAPAPAPVAMPYPVAPIHAPIAMPIHSSPIIVPAPDPMPVAALPIPIPPAGRHGHLGHHGGDGVLAPESPATAQAVKASGELLIGALYDRHCQEIAAGWLDSIGDAFSSGWHAVTRTIRQFKGPITVAATAVATTYGGQAGGQIAGQLTGPIIDAAAGSGDKQKQAQQVVAIATQAAKSSPRIAAALSAAQTAAAQTAAAYHVTSTAIDALRGNSEAMGKVDQLRQDAASGDPAARRALDLVTMALQAMMDGRGVGDLTTDQVGAVRRSGGLRQEATRSAVDAQAASGATALGVSKGVDGSIVVELFPDLDAADDWLGRLDPRSFIYAAYYDRHDPTWPSPINERTSGPGTSVGGGPLLPLLGLGAAGAGAYWWWKHREKMREQARLAAEQAADQAAHAAQAAHATPPSHGGATTTSGEIQHAKIDAIAAVQGLYNIVGQQGIAYFGYAKQRAAEGGHGRAVMVDTANAESFASPEEMWAWYHQVTSDPDGYEFVALFNATDRAWPSPFMAHEPPPQSARQGHDIPSYVPMSSFQHNGHYGNGQV